MRSATSFVRCQRSAVASVFLAAAAALALLPPVACASGLGSTTRVSVDSFGLEGNGASNNRTSISADGRYVAFRSDATNLVPGDSNSASDIFVRDRVSGTTTRVSVDSSNVQGNSYSYDPSLSADGRYVAFCSEATNLVAGYGNAANGVFVRDRISNITTLASVDSSGALGSGFLPSISADGRYVAFGSIATNLVPGDTNSAFDIFVRDCVSGATDRVSVDSSNVQGDFDSTSSPFVSANGRYVAFGSIASNLVPGDTNWDPDVFVRDRVSGTTTRVSLDSSGVQGNDPSYGGSISADGRYVAFQSFASNLVPGDTNGVSDTFVRDRVSGTTTRVSLDSSGVQGNGYSENPSISADGRYVAFQSFASNLVLGDTNGVLDTFVRDRGGSESGAVENPYAPPTPGTPGPPSTKPAIVLIGGIYDDYYFKPGNEPEHKWYTTYMYLKGALGNRADVIIAPSAKDATDLDVIDSKGGFDEDNALLLDNYLRTKLKPGQPVIYVGHSMGGLIARTHAARKPNRSGVVPRAIIQLGTPNAGSPMAAIKRWWPGADSNSIIQLYEGGDFIGQFNEDHKNKSPEVPVYQVAGTAVSGSHGLLGPMFGFRSSDGVVGLNSVLAAPYFGVIGSWGADVTHCDDSRLYAATLVGRHVRPKSASGAELAILRRLYGIIDAEIANRRFEDGGQAQRMPSSNPSSKMRVASAGPPADAGGWTTTLNQTVPVTGASAATVDFSLEGTSADIITTASMGLLSVSVETSSGSPVPPTTTFVDGVYTTHVAGISPGRYSAHLTLSGATSAEVALSVWDNGPSALRVEAPPQVGAGAPFTVNASIYQGIARSAAASEITATASSVSVRMLDDGISPDHTAGDGVYSASLNAPASASSLKVRFDSSGAAVRTGEAYVTVVEPRASLRGTYATRSLDGSSGKVSTLAVDVGVQASEDCTVEVRSDISSGAELLAQANATRVLTAGGVTTVTVDFPADDLAALAADGSFVVSEIVLTDLTDNMPARLDSATDAVSGVLAPSSLECADLTLAAEASSPTSATVVSLGGSALCTTEAITGVEVSLDGGATWNAAPEPADGWASPESTWTCAFSLGEGAWGAMARMSGATGVLASSSPITFLVDRTAPESSATVSVHGWSREATVTLSSSDASGAGAASNWYALGAGDRQQYVLPFVVTSEGDNTLSFASVDYAGNAEVTKTMHLLIDRTAPTTISNANAVYDVSASIKLTASDGTLSGVKKTEWRRDGSAWTSGTIVSGGAAGDHVLEFRSTDAVGNVEQTKVVRFRVRPKVYVRTPIAPKTMRRTKYYTVYGWLKPKHTSGTYPVRIYKWRKTASGKWKSYGYVKAKAANYGSYTKYSKKMKLASKGKWRLKAYAPADSWHAATWSSGYDYVTVR